MAGDSTHGRWRAVESTQPALVTGLPYSVWWVAMDAERLKNNRMLTAIDDDQA